MTQRKPPWLKIRLSTNPEDQKRFQSLRKLVKEQKLHTVCEEAHCPNMAECWERGTATFMILGDICTRCCKFCNVKTGNPGRKIDSDEPAHLANAISKMNLRYAVITSVDRDDLSDGGANHYANCIRVIRKKCPGTLIEVLIPDFKGETKFLDIVINAKPEVIGQNIETVKRLTHEVRDRRAGYEQTLKVLKYIKKKNPGIYTKSSILVGIGEKEEEVFETFRDLRESKVDFVTIGQYLQPSKKHYELKEYIHPDQFKKYENEALNMGFLAAPSGPFVRSSYKAGEFFAYKN